jgi:hypothetical protein
MEGFGFGATFGKPKTGWLSPQDPRGPPGPCGVSRGLTKNLPGCPGFQTREESVRRRRRRRPLPCRSFVVGYVHAQGGNSHAQAGRPVCEQASVVGKHCSGLPGRGRDGFGCGCIREDQQPHTAPPRLLRRYPKENWTAQRLRPHGHQRGCGAGAFLLGLRKGKRRPSFPKVRKS